MGTEKKETKKEKWQRIAKSKKVLFQDNDTIAMLVIGTAHKVGIDPDKVAAKDLESMVEDAWNKSNEPVKPKKPADKKPAAKKPAVKKPVAKKPTAKVTITPPEDLNTEKSTIELPEFKNVDEMKIFCVSHSLNKVDGYIPQTKLKKTVFLQWIKDNLDKAVAPESITPTSNPNSPSAGIGEFVASDNISKAIDSVGPGTEQSNTLDTGVKNVATETPPLDVPPLSPSNNENEPPTAISENAKVNSFKPNFGAVEEETNPVGNISEMEAYGGSIESHINNSFEVNIQHRNLPRAKLNELLGQCSKLYTYELKNDGNGNYLEVSDHTGNKCRTPKEGFLKAD